MSIIKEYLELKELLESIEDMNAEDVKQILVKMITERMQVLEYKAEHPETRIAQVPTSKGYPIWTKLPSNIEFKKKTPYDPPYEVTFY